ncbi:MAG: glycoside hydrolase family 25 protein [Clostridia bacterium]|nr:glycoside hydrolase family 25 protein [Clostridia bacterium]
MKKIITFLVIVLTFLFIANLSYANSNIKSVLHIDTDLENMIFDKNGIHIEGWKLATEPDTKLVILIDGKEVDNIDIQYSYKYDLISIVKGYGTYNENPVPNYNIKIPTTNITDGKHNLKIQLVTKNETILQSIEKTITIEKVKHALQIDTNLNNAVFDKSGIHIEGWKLATEPNSRIKILIDNQEISEQYIKYSYKYDLISIVQGYGTYKENPTPNYDIDIPTNNITDGKHNLKLQLVLEDGTILQNVEKTIIIEKVKYALQIDTNLNNAVFDKSGIHIEGWKLTTEPNSKIRILIDNQEMSEQYIKYSYKYDLISIVQGYGTYTENPTPNYDIDIPTTDITNGKHNLKLQLILEDGSILQSVEKTMTIDKSIKSIMHIDTNLKDIVFNEKKNIEISGWKLAAEPDSKLIILADGQELNSNCIKYSYKYDLISIVQGYGTYKENPAPNFDINISLENLSKKDYEIELRFVAADGTRLDSRKFVAQYGGKFNGIDVSSYNGDINWKQVAQSGVDFAMIRLGYRGYRNPVLVLDTKALYNIREAKAAGLKVGVYFVTQATNLQEAQEEGLWIISQIHQNRIELDYPIAIDTEDSGARDRGEEPGRADLLDRNTRTMTCRAIADIINYYGYKPMIYANHYWYEYELNYSELTNYEIWLAQYTHDELKQPNFSREYEMWQYTDKGSVSGISTNVDKNICYKKY